MERWTNGRGKAGAKAETGLFLDQYRHMRDRALFNLAVDSKLQGSDIVAVKIGDLVIGGQIWHRMIVVQQKTGKPMQFELMGDASASLLARPRRILCIGKGR